jgi:hypothetical protein
METGCQVELDETNSGLPLWWALGLAVMNFSGGDRLRTKATE